MNYNNKFGGGEGNKKKYKKNKNGLFINKYFKRLWIFKKIIF
jgi:hypothetical protein